MDMAYFGYDRQEMALDVLWYHIDRLDRLFNILAPMTYITPTTRVSSPLPTDTATFILDIHTIRNPAKSLASFSLLLKSSSPSLADKNGL
jgi:hypothetical protein